MRHIIVRSIMGLIWIIAGIIGMVNGHAENCFLSLIVGAAFIISAVSMWKKNRNA